MGRHFKWLGPHELFLFFFMTRLLGTCYICLDDVPDAPVSQCACRERYVHKECLLKMIKTSESTCCPVCLECFRNVVVRRIVSRQMSQEYFVIFVSYVSAGVLGSGAGIAMHSTVTQENLWMVWMLMVSMFLIGTAVAIFTYASCCFIQSVYMRRPFLETKISLTDVVVMS